MTLFFIDTRESNLDSGPSKFLCVHHLNNTQWCLSCSSLHAITYHLMIRRVWQILENNPSVSLYIHSQLLIIFFIFMRIFMFYRLKFREAWLSNFAVNEHGSRALVRNEWTHCMDVRLNKRKVVYY